MLANRTLLQIALHSVSKQGAEATALTQCIRLLWCTLLLWADVHLTQQVFCITFKWKPKVPVDFRGKYEHLSSNFGAILILVQNLESFKYQTAWIHNVSFYSFRINTLHQSFIITFKQQLLPQHSSNNAGGRTFYSAKEPSPRNFPIFNLHFENWRKKFLAETLDNFTSAPEEYFRFEG